jgi:serine phosphatase RsbU (regulator of sigma subunit)/CHASE3 domain sensor protein
MSLWRRVLAVAMAILVASVLLGVAVSRAVHRSNQAVAEVAMRWAPANARAQALLAHLVDQETGERGYVITGDPAYLTPYRSGATGASNDITTLVRLGRGDPDIAAALTQVQNDMAAWRSQSAAPEIAARQSGVVDAAQLVRSGVGKRLFDILRADVEKLQGLIEKHRGEAQSRVTGDNHTLTAWLWVTAAAALIIGVGVLLAMRQWVLHPLHQLSRALLRVSSGDLDATVAVTGPPEFVQVAEDADGMRRRILDALERSEMSRQALEQTGPVVLGLSQALSPQLTEPVPGLRYAAALRPAVGILAGDWVDVLPLGDDRVALLLLDVSGHGAAAGLEAMRLKHVLTTALRFGHPPHQAMARAAAGFTEDERFATAVVVVLDVVTGDLRWANAGHLAPRIVPMRGDRIDEEDLVPLRPTGPLLSSLGGTWTTASGRLEVGHMIIAFSDGLTEARDAVGREFGVEGLCTALSQATVRDVDTAVSVCVAAARAHAADAHRDDVTVLAAARDPSTVLRRDSDASRDAGQATRPGAQRSPRD